MPALNLDAAFVHLNLGDAQGNAAYTGIDPYFDDLFLMAAEQRFLSVERVVSTEELVKSVPPQALLVNRMMVDTVVEAPNGAHFTTAEPDYRPRREVPAALRRGRRHPTRRGRSSSPPTCPAARPTTRPRCASSQTAGGTKAVSQVISVTRAEVCAVACAELFRDAGEIMVSPMTTMVSIGARLARLTFSPDILLTDGEARLLADTPAIGATAAIEGWMPFGRVFETLAWGRRHVVMGANQIDRFGNQNLSAFGPLQHPTRQMFGVRGAPGNTINHATSYWVGNHSKRVFGESVDIVSGIGWDKVDPDNPAFRFANVYRVVTNLGVFDFNGPDHQMRAVSLHPGVEPDQVAENTSFEVHGLDEAEDHPAAHRRRAAADPRGHRSEVAAGQRESRCDHELLRTPLTELVGIEHPVVQTGMGWVAGARLVSATANAGGLGILASATMTLDELADRGRQGQGRHRQAVRHQHPRRRRRRRRPRRPADPRRRQGRLVRAGAQAGTDRQAQRCRRRGDSVGRRGQARQEGRGLGRRRGDRAGRRGRRPHRPGRHHAAAAVGARRRRDTVCRSSPRAASSTAAAWPPRCPTAPPGSRWAPASC